MVKVKECLDSGCNKFILVEDGRCFIQPKNICNSGDADKDFSDKFAKLVPKITETVYISKETLKVKVGDEVPI